MNIKSAFLSCLVSCPRAFHEESGAEKFLGYIFPERDLSASPLLNLLSFGTVKASSPWSFDFNLLNCYLLLYTTKGCGKLTVNNQVFSLSEASLLFLDCQQRFRLDIALSSWEYQLIMLEGHSLSYYYELIPKGTTPVIAVLPYSDISMCFERLGLWCKKSSYNELVVSDLLNHLITCFTSELLKESNTPPNVPFYITELKRIFDTKFNDVYTLDRLEEALGVSKYRLCREFKQAYSIPPFQYLNQKRMEYATHLLTSTNYRIHEIGSLTGIDNTNHFISQFKKIYKITPLEYRQRMSS